MMLLKSVCGGMCCGASSHCVRLINCVTVCSTDNTAECMFREMKRKDGGTYEALIQGLIKVWHLYVCLANSDLFAVQQIWESF